MEEKPIKICSVDGCDKTAKSRGCCETHYYRLKRYGDPLKKESYTNIGQTCSTEGCDNPAKTLGLCKKHYKENMNNRTIQKGNCCTIEGCSNILDSHSSRGMCQLHYRRFTKHGDPMCQPVDFHGRSNTTEYKSWRMMMDRCYNPNNNRYYRYGGRGIKVCDRWIDSFSNFYEDMGNKPFKNSHIDRIKNDLYYEKSNCKWNSLTKNNRHKGDTKLSMEKAREIRGLYPGLNMMQIAEKYGCDRKNISAVLNYKTWKEDEDLEESESIVLSPT